MRRFARLPAAERRLLVRMAVVLWGTRLGLWVVSMQTVHRALGRLMPVRAGWRRSVPFSAERIAWAARVGSRYVPRATCLVQALAVQRLLEREGHPACLRIGVAKSGRARLLAHAWVESADRVVVGGGTLERYGPLLAWERERHYSGLATVPARHYHPLPGRRRAGAGGACLFDPRAGLPRCRRVPPGDRPDRPRRPAERAADDPIRGPRGGSSPADRRRALGAAVLLPL